MKNLFIDGIPDTGAVSMVAAIQQRTVKTTQRGRQFLSLTLCDKTGTIDAVMWDIEGVEISELQPDTVHLFEGTAGLFDGKPQLTISEIRDAYEGTDYELTDLVRASAFDPDMMLDSLVKYVEALEGDEPLKRLLLRVLRDEAIAPRLKRSVAGIRIHHCFAGGLLEHILSMTRAAWLLCNHYRRLNRSLLVAGCILHDLCKIDEISTGISFRYTKAGTLIGHIVMSYALVEKLAAETGLTEETKIQLQHLILSHHGEPEHGAVKLPCTPEAIALSQIDVLDARLEQAWRLIDEAPASDEFTAYVPSLQRALYCGAVACPEKEQEVVAA
jgi:3'-5' exoribonuclease